MEYPRFRVYVALFKKSVENMYYAEFPDLPGCFTQGKTLEETFCKAHEALAIYYKENLTNMPEATDISEINRNNTDPNTIVQLVSIDTKHVIKSTKAVKKNLTVPEWLNNIAEKHPINYSQILKNGLIVYLKSLDTLSEHDRILLDD